jgi:protein O-mannosyl-transferase
VRIARTELLRIAPLIPALAVVLVWLPSLGGSFQFDDFNVIVNEPRVHSLSAWWASMPGIRPLLKLSYALSYSIAPGAFGFRVLNVLIHALNASLVFQVLRMLGRRVGLTDSLGARAALFGALIFALHPVQTEAVTYISGRSSSLAACFCLVSMLFWARGNTIASSIAFVAAVASKETAIVLPLALWLYSADRPVRETLWRLSPIAGVTLLLLTIVVALPTYRHLLEVSLATRTVSENLLTQAHGVTYLAGQLLRPWNGNADPQLPAVAGYDAVTLALGCAWAAALFAALACVRRARTGAFAVLWFLLWLAPTNSLLPRLDPANDRQLYLALIGPAWWLAVQLSRPAVLLRTRVLAGSVIVVLLCAATIERNTIYETEVSFWEDTAARNPSSSRAANNLGMAYAVDCRREEALEEFSRAIELDGTDFRPRMNRLLLQGNELPETGCRPRDTKVQSRLPAR